MSLDRLRAQLEDLLEAVARERLQLRLGGGRASGIGALYAQAAPLVHLERVSEVQMALSGAAGEEAKRIRMLLEGIAEARGRCAAAGELDRFLTWRGAAHIRAGGTRVGVVGAAPAIGAVSNPEERHAAEESLLAALDAQAPLLEGLHAARRNAVEELGYGDYASSVGILSGIDLPALARDAERFLAETESGYRELLDWHLPRLTGVDPDAARVSDTFRLERAAGYDEWFTGRELTGQFVRLTAGTGLDPRADGRLEVRKVPASSLAPGASANALRVPGEVVVLLRPGAGRAVHAALLRALGIAQHAAHTRDDLPLEYRRLGDEAVALAFGYLFEGLLEERPVLSRELGLPSVRAAECMRLAALLLLLRTRADAARLLFELEWAADPARADRDQRYAELLTDATGVRWDPRATLTELIEPFRSARALRAEQLRSVLALHLRERYDEDWHRNPRTGPALRELLSGGRSFTADELAVQVASAPLSFGPVHTRLAELAG